MNRYSTLLAILLLCGSPAGVLAADNQDLMAEAEKASASGDWEKATTLYRQAVDKDPTSSLALSRLAGSLLAAQKYTDSIPVFQQAISKDPKNAGAFIGMGISYLHTGRYTTAKAAFEEAKKLQPDKKELDEVMTWIDNRLTAEEKAAALPHSLPKPEQQKEAKP